MVCAALVLLFGTASRTLAFQNVTLGWDPSPDVSVAGYRLYYGTASGVYAATNDVGGATSGTAVGLTEGTTYFFVVTAYDALGLESVPSNEVTFTIPDPALEGWRTQYFSAVDLADPAKEANVWGDLADPDRDGRVNLMDYALGLSPIGRNNNSTGISTRVAVDGGNYYHYLSFTRRKTDGSLSYLPEVSGDKQSWSADAGSVAFIAANSLGTDFETAIYKDLTPVAPGQSRFFQLVISRSANGSVIASATSESYVASTVSFQGSSGTRAQISYFAPSLVQPVVAGGMVSSLGASSLTDSAASWTDSQFAGASGAFYVEFASGLRDDIIGTIAAIGTLNLASDVRSLISPGQTYRIRKHITLADVFGPNNEAGLLAGSSPAAADNVVLLSAQSQSLELYFYCNVPGYTGWYRGDFQSANDAVIYPEEGIAISRKAPSAATCYLHGISQSGRARVPLWPGLNLIGTLSSAKSLTLSELNLYTGDPTTGLAGGSNPAAADNLVVPSANGLALYFYCTVAGYTGWYDGAFNPANSVVIPPQAAFYIKRKAPNAAFNWIISAQ